MNIWVCLFAATAFLGACFVSPAFAADPVEIEFWQSVKDTRIADELRVFLDAYPNSTFAPLARIRLDRLAVDKEIAPPAAEIQTAAAPTIPPVPDHRQVGYAGFRIVLAASALEEIASPGFRPKYLVVDVFPYGAAEKVGLQTGDIVVSINNYRPRTIRDFVEKLKIVAPGGKARMEIERDGEVLSIELVTGDRFAVTWIAAHQGNGMAMAALANEYRFGELVDKDMDRAVSWIARVGSAVNPYAIYLRGTYAENKLTGEKSQSEAQSNALSYYLRAAEAGLPEGYSQASWILAQSDPERALQLAEKAFLADPMLGVTALYSRMKEQGILSWSGRDLSELLVGAAKSGSIPALRELGLEYANSSEPEKIRIGVGLVRNAADRGDAVAQRELGDLYRQGIGVAESQEYAFFWYLKAAEAGEAEAQALLGKAYYFGRGTEKDIDKAYQWFERASGANNATGHFYIAYMSGRGEATPKDDERAVEYYHRAAELGDKDAMTNLGIRYQVGRGVEKDMIEAAHWYQLGMDAGALNANSGVGYMYRHGYGGYPKDPKKAVEVFRNAAALGNTSGQYNLGLMYEAGEGVRKDMVEAIRLYRLAAGDEKRAKKALERLGTSLYDPQEIQQILANLGYDPGPVDGKPGARTRSAVRAFQEDQNVAADGKLDMTLLDRLRRALNTRENANSTENRIASSVNAGNFSGLDREEGRVLTELEDALDF